MSTTITNQPSDQATSPSEARPVHHPRHRALLAVVVAAALGVGAGAAAVSLTSSSGDGAATSEVHTPASAAPSVAPQVDVEAMWNELVTLPVHDQTAVVASLSPGVRAQLHTYTEAVAGEVEGR
jgi:hypothetical protein